jgi:ribose/xylose/arabinose/galactoside ABC-type transport system permease subunit
MKSFGRLATFLLQHGFLVVLAAVFAFFAIFTNTFLASGNLIDMLHAMSPLMTISAGLALVVMAGKLDISVGSVAFVAASVGTLLMTRLGCPSLLALAAALSAGALLGALNGFIVVVLGVNPLITTLGTMIAFRGVGLQLTNAQVERLPEGVRELGNWSVGPFFGDTLIALAIVLAVDLLHRHTVFGRQLTAIGNGEDVARRIGMPVDRLVFVAFVLSGVLAAVGGVLDTLQIGAISAYLGKGLEFNAVAVIVVGGVSLFGGRGRILSSVVLGALVFELIRNGLNHLGANPYAYRLVSGAVIFAAMYADALKSRVRRTTVGAPAPSEA